MVSLISLSRENQEGTEEVERPAEVLNERSPQANEDASHE
jgi:hypothetical protein